MEKLMKHTKKSMKTIENRENKGQINENHGKNMKTMEHR